MQIIDEVSKVVIWLIRTGAAYKIIMGCDGRDLEDIIALYHLTDSEQELVYSKRRGHALCMVGSKRLHIWFFVSEYKMALIGRGGGR